MEHTDVKGVKKDPTLLLDFLKSNKYAVYHRSNIFFRDFQYGLWRYLRENQTKVPYADMEKVTKDVIDAWESRGLLKRVNRQSFELNMPEYITIWPTAEDGKNETEPPKGKPAPASGPAATQPPAATEASDAEKEAKLAELKAKMAAAKAKTAAPEAPAPAVSSAAGPAPLTVPPGTDADKAAKIAELQAKMAAAKAKRETGEG